MEKDQRTLAFFAVGQSLKKIIFTQTDSRARAIFVRAPEVVQT